jgi:hypothetical protein
MANRSTKGCNNQHHYYDILHVSLLTYTYIPGIYNMLNMMKNYHSAEGYGNFPNQIKFLIYPT